MPEKCNIDAITGAALMAKFPDGLSPEEEEQAISHFTKYLFYHRLKNNRRRYLCTNCGFSWEAEPDGYKHNDLGSCCNCHQAVTYKAVGRLGGGTGYRYPSLHEEHNMVFLRAADDGALLISAGRAVADYEPGQFSGWPCFEDEPISPIPTFDFWERRRYYLRPGQLASWKRDFGIYKGPWGVPIRSESSWESCKTAGEPNQPGSYMYPQPDSGRYFVIGWENLPGTELRYSAVDQYFNPCDDLFRGVVSYLARYTKRPQMEMLVKLGHTDVIDRMLAHDDLSGRRVNWKAKTPHGFFRLGKADYRAFANAHASLESLDTYRNSGVGLPLKEFYDLGAARYSAANLQSMKVIGDRYHVPLPKLLRYCKGQATMWLDYVSMGRKLGLDFSRPDVLMPKDLRARHDNAMEQVEYQSNMDAIKKYRRGRYRMLKKRYEMEAAGYLIRVPAHGGEIRAEGKALCHCVGGYAKRHMEGATTILFLRAADDPDTPLCTIEMEQDGETIRQIHGYCNDRYLERPEKLYAAFLDIWLPWVAAGSRRDLQGRPILPSEQPTEKMNKEAV